MNKNVDREEALAGIELLNKHNEAMKRYQRSNSNAASDNLGKQGIAEANYATAPSVSTQVNQLA